MGPPRELPGENGLGHPAALPLHGPGQLDGGPVGGPFSGRGVSTLATEIGVRHAVADGENSAADAGPPPVPTPVGRLPEFPAADPAFGASAPRQPEPTLAKAGTIEVMAPEADPLAMGRFPNPPPPVNSQIASPPVMATDQAFPNPMPNPMPNPAGNELAAPLGNGPLGNGPLGNGPLGNGPLGNAPLGTGIDAFPPRDDGIGRPGGKQLEGPQSPQLTIRKSAPEEIQVGKSATFLLTVRNTGSTAATGVQVHDLIPRGCQLVDTTPRALQQAPGELTWNLGTIAPGEEVTVEMHVKPIVEGEIGSVATVTFRAEASARTMATQPKLVVTTSAPKEVLTGEKIKLSIEVSNPGTGTATGVMLEEHVPPGLQHEAGADLEYPIGDLPPGASRKLELTMTASGDGQVINVLTVTADDGLKAQHQLSLNILAPKLDVQLTGPKRRFLERKATYQVRVHNPGTAAAERIELVAYLPRGLKFVSANRNGHYEESNRAVYWQLAELPVGEADTLELVTLPVEAGQQKLRLRGTALRGIAVEQEHAVAIEGIAAIMFEVVDLNDPVEVGGETTFEIRVLNQGSKAAGNVRLWVTLPPQMQAIDAKGPVRYAVQGNRITFEPIPSLAPKADTTYRVRVKGIQTGDLRTIVQLQTDDMRIPVTKEESTQVYSDE